MDVTLCNSRQAYGLMFRGQLKFTLVVDDFRVKFEGLQHANHLKATLECWYDITVDWEGSKYVGINLK